jgi:hypothetical protein
MAESSFWEKLGRGVGYWWEKTKELGSQLGDQVEGHAELTQARTSLTKSYTRLGEIIAKEVIDCGKDTSAATIPGVPELLETIRAQRAFVDRLEQEYAAKERELAEREAQEGSGEPRQPPGNDDKSQGSATGTGTP